jgi:chromate transporter
MPLIDPGDAAPPECKAPGSLSELFFAFNRMALQGFGGVLAVAQVELVERLNWMTREQFVETLSISQVLPGPNIVNMALIIGDRHFGLRGAFAALGGMLLLPLVIVLVLTALYAHYASHPVVSGALRGMGAVAAGLVISTALKLSTTLNKGAMGLPLGLGLALLTFIAVGLLRWPLAWVLLGLGPLAVALAWYRMGRPA